MTNNKLFAWHDSRDFASRADFLMIEIVDSLADM